MTLKFGIFCLQDMYFGFFLFLSFAFPPFLLPHSMYLLPSQLYGQHSKKPTEVGTSKLIIHYPNFQDV